MSKEADNVAGGTAVGGRARYVMIGGFLGAGKTTAVAALASRFHKAGAKVGLITNDQGTGLVDTAMLNSKGFPVEEIAGGCFCCRFQSLTDAARKLSENAKPDVFLAEPVGSCTDLVATVTYPLRRMYGEAYSIAPLSVVMDPVRAMRVLGLEEGRKFSEKVAYIYLKQLEEADLLVVNKCDMHEQQELEKLQACLRERFALADILVVSARTGTGMDEWHERIRESEQVTRAVMDVDYGRYGEGEALLGWLNASMSVNSDRSFDGNALLQALAVKLQGRLEEAGAEIAHMKMTLEPSASLGGELGVINLVRNDFVPELSQELEEAMERGHLIVNLRAEADPGLLRKALEGALGEVAGELPSVALTLDHVEAFRPGQPVPTHRDGG